MSHATFEQSARIRLTAAAMAARRLIAHIEAGVGRHGRAEHEARFVFVLLRGALDGLAAVPAYGGSGLSGVARRAGARRTGHRRRVPLDACCFGTCIPVPAVSARDVRQSAAVVFHAIATPYRERSHFDGQDVLENGSDARTRLQTGWLNRALVIARTRSAVAHPGSLGVALGQNIPLVMRGPAGSDLVVAVEAGGSR